ncbi:MAG: acetate--CoA ligase, partial [Amnibacterium sp.]
MSLLTASGRWPTIHKDVNALRVPPNLVDYAATCASFTWDAARATLDGLPGGGLNIAHEAVDRHAVGAAGEKDALRFVRADGSVERTTYAQLREATDRFAGVLRGLGV